MLSRVAGGGKALATAPGSVEDPDAAEVLGSRNAVPAAESAPRDSSTASSLDSTTAILR